MIEVPESEENPSKFKVGDQVFLSAASVAWNGSVSYSASLTKSDKNQENQSVELDHLKIADNCANIGDETPVSAKLLQLDTVISPKDNRSEILCRISKGTVIEKLRVGLQSTGETPSEEPSEGVNPAKVIKDVFDDVLGIDTVAFDGELPEGCSELKVSAAYGSNRVYTLSVVKAP